MPRQCRLWAILKTASGGTGLLFVDWLKKCAYCEVLHVISWMLGVGICTESCTHLSWMSWTVTATPWLAAPTVQPLPMSFILQVSMTDCTLDRVKEKQPQGHSFPHTRPKTKSPLSWHLFRKMVPAAYGLSCLPDGIQIRKQQEWSRSSLRSLDQTQKVDVTR